MNSLLSECGAALYGPHWKTELAGALNISERTVRRWDAGTQPVPPGAYADLLRLTQERAALLDSLTGRLLELG